MNKAEFDALKQQYKPDKVKLLFVADGVPIGHKYFYLKNSNLYKAIKAAFVQVFGEFKSDDEFLEFFKEMGCYIDNISDKPVKDLPPAQQRTLRQEGVPQLASHIAQMKPQLVIISLKVIEKQVREAIAQSGVDSIEQVVVTPFPVKSLTNVNNCINGIVGALRSVEWE
ncbi:hypothetical protein KHS38_15960 [Mucilaginibacter sp. Bleaf8]|uniref:hypothetical protein n=1 Tax=Mucilaginibacter sp. Bleaf8 TaxID=2834430 RepID=UPI001BD0263D|nr:hypothetical protein [Mucilaginibacter sp. Bleaf8]MBS7565903.1 hypothetical protein [Mucilaginibacter sp. Bleaf8]